MAIFVSPVSGEDCLAWVDELVPKYRRVTTLHFRGPHGDSMFKCINEYSQVFLLLGRGLLPCLYAAYMATACSRVSTKLLRP